MERHELCNDLKIHLIDVMKPIDGFKNDIDETKNDIDEIKKRYTIKVS